MNEKKYEIIICFDKINKNLWEIKRGWTDRNATNNIIYSGTTNIELQKPEALDTKKNCFGLKVQSI